MTWTDLAKNNLQAARRTFAEEPRSCVSPAYYAAHGVLAEALVNAGCPLKPGRQTPSHGEQAKLIGQYLGKNGVKFVRDARAVIRRLYQRRLDADYKRTVTVDRAIALESVRDASTLFELLNVR